MDAGGARAPAADAENAASGGSPSHPHAMDVSGGAPSCPSSAPLAELAVGGTGITAFVEPGLMNAQSPPSFDMSGLDFRTMDECLEWVSEHIWGVKEGLRDIQLEALTKMLDPSNCGGKLLLASRTGSGKTHVMRMLGATMGGVIVVLVPLLSLSADQMEKMTSAEQNYGEVRTFHLDELPSKQGVLDPVINRIDLLEEETSKAVFLFTSPQFLVRKSSKPLLDALLRAHKRTVLRAVVIDEAHLYVQHSSFRPSIRKLKDELFVKVFPKDRPETHPVFMAGSATVTQAMIPKLEKLTNVALPEECRVWPDREHYEQRSVHIGYATTNNFTERLDRPVGIVTNSIEGEEHRSTEAVVVLTTTAKSAIDLHTKFCDKLNKKLGKSDVVLVHGDLHKIDKFWRMRLFCGKERFEHFLPRGLVTNGSGNTGIDYYDITDITRAGLPMDLQNAFQEKGRLVRKEGSTGRIVYLCNLDSYLQILHLLYQSTGKASNSRSSDGVRGANTAIQERLVEWFQSSDFKEPISTAKKSDALTNLLWKGKESWLKLIFGVAKRSIRKYNVECLMESLIAAKIIVHKTERTEKGIDIQFVLNRKIVAIQTDDGEERTERPCYEFDSYWIGINLR